ncbi:glycosyltransferase family 39 protein [Myxococcota bacterium]|nr:glycosyltransferase family 39 protein [Myxococcota bacterium]
MTVKHPAPIFTPQRDPLWVALLGLGLIGGLLPFLGVWEPWEAKTANIIQAMRETGAWMRLQVPNGDGFDVIPDLPFRAWLAVLTTKLFGMNELGLRLPGLLLGLPILVLLFDLGRRMYGRLAGWLAVLALLTMPLFTYHSRFALGGAEIMGLTALSTLAFLRLILDGERAWAWRWIAWLTWAGAALTGGLPAALVPLAVPVVAAARGADLKRLLGAAPVGLALLLVAVGLWRAIHYQPEGNLKALLLWADGLNHVVSAKDRPSFELFVHQIGFGLFPLGALLPLAFADLLWDEARPEGAVPLTAAFAVAFLAPAIGMSYSHYALFLGAPFVALAVGAYLARVLKGDPQPLLIFTAVILIALVDSNLKHETHALADTLVSERVDAFPPQLTGWWLARLINFALLGLLIIHQGGFHRFFVPIARALAYPSRSRGLLNYFFLPPALLPAGLLFWKRPDAFMAFMAWRGWGRLLPDARSLIVFVGLTALTYVLLCVLWGLRVRLLRGRRDGWVTALASELARYGRDHGVITWGLIGVLLASGLFINGLVAHALTVNFSQREILNRYQASATGEEPLFRYQIPPQTRSFYTRNLKELDRKAFKQRAAEDSRFYAIIPRDLLARINTEFRDASGRTLPVLDDRSYRYLLVSNQLKDGEEDKSPIKRAIVPALPPDANPVKINFEDKVELIGWRVSPERPRPGSPVTLTLFWRPLKEMRNQWKIFVHIDAPGQRIHGDHDPVEGLYPTSDWKTGDIIQDIHYKVINSSITPARFTFYAGLYRGSQRMKIKSGPKDNDNRAQLGSIRVR